MNAAVETVHGTCLVLGEQGVLIRGEPGSGKSCLCLSLLDEAERAKRHGALVGDDRVLLEAHHGRLIGRPHPAIAGLIEIRGVGLRGLDRTSDAAVIRLVVDLVAHRPRLPDGEIGRVDILGLRLPALALASCQPREYLIRQALATLRRESVSSQTHSTRDVAPAPFCV